MNQQGLESFKAPTPSWYALTQHKGAIPGWKDALLQGSSKGVKPEWKGEDFAKDTLMSSSLRKYNSTAVASCLCQCYCCQSGNKTPVLNDTCQSFDSIKALDHVPTA
jgi:hypothetical protein